MLAARFEDECPMPNLRPSSGLGGEAEFGDEENERIYSHFVVSFAWSFFRRPDSGFLKCDEQELAVWAAVQGRLLMRWGHW